MTTAKTLGKHPDQARIRREGTAAQQPSRRHGERRAGTRSNTRGDGDIRGPGRRGSIDPTWIRADQIRMGG